MVACPLPDVERRAVTRGGRLYVRSNGPESGGVPLVMIHGGPGGNHFGMVGCLPLADRHRVILYDQLDCGLSDRPGDPANWTVERFASEVDAVRAAFGLSEIHLAGGSWGGTLALEYAARAPAGLKSLILISPLVSTRAWLADAGVHIAAMPEEAQAAIREAIRTSNFDSYIFQDADRLYSRRHLSRERLSPLHLACIGRRDPLFNLELYTRMWGPSEFVVTGTLAGYDGEPLLEKVAVPTLLLAGEHDEARPDTVRGFAARIRNSSFRMVPGAGHWVENDRPTEYVQALRDWLEAMG